MYATAELTYEHDIIRQALKVLNYFCIRANTKNWLPLEHTKQLVSFFTEFVAHYHHGKEECVFFPALKQLRGRQVESLLPDLLTEHQAGHKLVSDMQHAYKEYRTGHSEVIPTFVRHAQEYIMLMSPHLAKEDTVLYPVADQISTSMQHLQLIKAFEMLEDGPLEFGKQVEYHRLIYQFEEIYREEYFERKDGEGYVRPLCSQLSI